MSISPSKREEVHTRWRQVILVLQARKYGMTTIELAKATGMEKRMMNANLVYMRNHLLVKSKRTGYSNHLFWFCAAEAEKFLHQMDRARAPTDLASISKLCQIEQAEKPIKPTTSLHIVRRLDRPSYTNQGGQGAVRVYGVSGPQEWI